MEETNSFSSKYIHPVSLYRIEEDIENLLTIGGEVILFEKGDERPISKLTNNLSAILGTKLENVCKTYVPAIGLQVFRRSNQVK